MPEDLRPYYDKESFNAGYLVVFRPGVGLVHPDTNQPLTSAVALNVAARATKPVRSPNGLGIASFGSSNSADKNFYDVELQEYFDYTNAYELVRNLAWNFVKNYLRVLVSQPLEITRLVLQVGYFPHLDRHHNRPQQPSNHRLLEDGTETDEEIDYFTSIRDNETPKLIWGGDEIEGEGEGEGDLTQPQFQDNRTVGNTSSNADIAINANNSANNANIANIAAKFPHQIYPVSKHTVDIMTALVTKDGPLALFRGINASFIYQTLSHTIEAWITGFILPFLGIPDPFFLELTRLTDPWKSLWLSVLACVLTGLILIPLDLIRIRLMVTQFNNRSDASDVTSDDETALGTVLPRIGVVEDVVVQSVPECSPPLVNVRSIRDSLRNYPAAYIAQPPAGVVILTALHRFSLTIFRKAAPYILFIKYNMDSYRSPRIYTIVNLALLMMEFFVKLLVENLLRKEQVRFLLTSKGSKDPFNVVSIVNAEQDLVVAFNDGLRYGDEPFAQISLLERVRRLRVFDGWRVGVLNVVGFWGYNIVKGSGEFAEERL